MGKRFRKITLWLVSIIILIIIGLVLFSPYRKWDGQGYRSVQASIEINLPVDSVFQFMGNSKLASSWSVYVDDITTLNQDTIPDGAVGSVRRCFARPKESGQQWDEVISIVEKNKKRQLIIYNLVKFPIIAEGLKTEQLYEKLGEKKTKLTLTLFYNRDKPSNMEWFKTKIAAYEIKRIFKGNLQNIKRIIEEGK